MDFREHAFFYTLGRTRVNRGAGGSEGSPRQRSYEGATLSPYTRRYAHTLLGASRGTESAGAWSVVAAVILAA